MSDVARLLVFTLDEHRYALPLAVVQRVIFAASVTPLPDAPALVLGIINVHGQVMPVFDLRRRFQIERRGMVPSDRFLLVQAGHRPVALVIDEAQGILDCPEGEVVRPSNLLPGAVPFPGVVRCADGLVLIHDIDQFLSLDEVRDLEAALRNAATTAAGIESGHGTSGAAEQ